MKVLLIGFSRIAERRVLAALQAAGATIAGIASRSRSDQIVTSIPGIKGFDSYEKALSSVDVDLVYISTVNSYHLPIAEMSLQRGIHTVIDKPAFLTLDDAVRLVELAKKNNCCLAETVVFPYHPRVLSAKQILISASSPVSAMTATFSFPPLSDSDFRYKRDLGGGALSDLGPYAAACCRVFFEASPVEIAARIVSRKYDVEDSFSLLAMFSDSRVMIGHFGYHTAYVNRVDLIGPEVCLTLDRVFTPPRDLTTEIIVERNTKKEVLTTEPADSFTCFFEALFRDIKKSTFDHFMSDLLWDAKTLNAIRQGLNGPR